jgi:hypothetical protein
VFCIPSQYVGIKAISKDYIETLKKIIFKELEYQTMIDWEYKTLDQLKQENVQLKKKENKESTPGRIQEIRQEISRNNAIFKLARNQNEIDDCTRVKDEILKIMHWEK